MTVLYLHKNTDHSITDWSSVHLHISKLFRDIFFDVFLTNKLLISGNIIQHVSIYITVLTMALSDINSNNTILPNHKLIPVVRDGECKADMVMKRFIDIIMNEEFKKSFIGILGK